MKAVARVLLPLAILSLLFTPPARAQCGGHPSGPSAGYMTACIALPWEPPTFLIGTPAGGLYRLTEGSPRWEMTGRGLPRESVVLRIVATPAVPGNLYLSLAPPDGMPTVYRSTDRGENWTVASSAMIWAGSALACDPVDPLTAYAGTYGVQVTRDGGETWSSLGLSNEAITCITVDPVRPQRIWAAAYGVGVYRTDDGGGTWTLFTAGMEGDPYRYFFDLPISSDGEIIYTCAGLINYRSTDGGGSWSVLPCFPGDSFMMIGIRADDSGALLATTVRNGIARSTDGGSTWTRVGPQPLTDYNYICRDPIRPGRALVDRVNGELFVTDDDGESWTLRNAGVADGQAFGIDARGSRVLVGTAIGLFVSEDGGSTWGESDLNNAMPTINSVSIASSGLTAFCGGFRSGSTGNVYRSADGGWTWTSVTETGQNVNGVAVDPTNPNRVYVAAGDSTLGSFHGGVHYTADGGLTWIFRDLGPTYCVQVRADNPAIIVAGTHNGIKQSTDYGNSWTQRGSHKTVLDLSSDDSDPQRLYAACGYRGIWSSSDGGQSWTSFDGGPPGLVTSVEGRDPIGVLAGTTELLWLNDGSGWFEMPCEERPMISGVRSLCAVPGYGKFLVGMEWCGIWEYRDTPASAPDAPGVVASRLLDLAIQGSPSAGPFTISPTVRVVAPCRIEIADIAGRRILTRETSRSQVWIWDGRDGSGAPVPAGIYLVRVEVGSARRFGKICVVR